MSSPKWLNQFEETYGDRETIFELLRAYLRDTSKIRGEILILSQNSEFQELEKWVHSLKSASAVFGDSKLWQTLQKAEISLKNGQIVEGLKFYLNADAELAKLEIEIQDYLKEVGNQV